MSACGTCGCLLRGGWHYEDEDGEPLCTRCAEDDEDTREALRGRIEALRAEREATR